MIQHFQSAVQHNADAYVVDYSELTHQERGVEILYEKPEDILAFHLSNPHHHAYWAVNFEKHPAFFRDESNCECMFTSIRNDHKPKKWALFVELKYCKEKNITGNATDAISQLINTQRLIKEHNIIDDQYSIFLNISIPEHSHKQPFTEFTPSEIKQKQDELGVIILGYNQIVILTPTHIKIPREEV